MKELFLRSIIKNPLSSPDLVVFITQAFLLFAALLLEE